jgi:inorganic pyrophosphatase
VIGRGVRLDADDDAQESSRSKGESIVNGAERQGFGGLIAILLGFVAGCAGPDLLRGIDPVNSDLTISVVIENPVGGSEKWEVRSSGKLIQEEDNGRPIEIPFLAWPVNAAMIPRTLLSRDLGGDGEPLDVLVLGASIARGEVIRARAIGLLHVVDALERDDKILAVQEGTPFASLKDVAELEEKFSGVQDILSGWYSHSRPGGAIDVQGYGSRGDLCRPEVQGAGIRGSRRRGGSSELTSVDRDGRAGHELCFVRGQVGD